jgi:hypothetical protein
MRTIISLIIAMMLGTIGLAQDVLEWNPKYKLQLSDFQSSATQVGDVSFIQMQNGAEMEFSFQMTNLEFVFRKNFNSYAKCTFHKNIAVIVANDSASANNLLQFARFQYDLTELYTRKFRKALFDEKGFFTKGNFYQPLFNRIHNELNVRIVEANKQCNMGENSEQLASLHQEVLKELADYSDYCYHCKPVKRKKKR